LLAYGARGPAKLLLQHSAVTSEFMQSATGILALAAASLARDVWKFAWHHARGLCGRLGDSDAVDARRRLAAMLCHWALKTGDLGEFLEAAMDADEQDEVHRILADLAAKEVEVSAFPAHALDTLVYWLLRLRRIPEAKLLHEQHCTSLRSRPRTPDFVQRFGDIEARASLIESCAAFSAVQPRELKAIPGRALPAPQPTAEQSFIPASYFLRARETEEDAEKADAGAIMDTTDGTSAHADYSFATGKADDDGGLPAAYAGITWAARSTSRPTINLDDDGAAVSDQATAMDTTDAPAIERVEFAADRVSNANRSRIASLLESSTAATFSRTEPTPSSALRGSSSSSSSSAAAGWDGHSFERSPAVNLSQLPNPHDFKEELYSPTPFGASDTPSSGAFGSGSDRAAPLPFNSAVKRFGAAAALAPSAAQTAAAAAAAAAPAAVPHSGVYPQPTASEMRGTFVRFDGSEDTSPLHASRRRVRFSTEG
jgi:hypothetical protein